MNHHSRSSPSRAPTESLDFRFRRGIRAYAACVLLAAVFIGQVSGDTLHVGVLAPSTGPFANLGEQIFASASISSNASTYAFTCDIELHRIDAEPLSPQFKSGPYNWDVFEKLKADNIDVVIGGYTPAESAILRGLATDAGIPTVLLAPTYEIESSSSDFVLEMGPTWEEVYSKSVAEWASVHQLDDLVVMFDFGDDESYEYGSIITRDALPPTYSLNEIVFSSRKAPYFVDELAQIRSFSPDGVIVAGVPQDSASIVRQIDVEYDVPIFVANPVGWSQQLADIARGIDSRNDWLAEDWKSTSSAIYFGVPVWSDPTDKYNIEFASRLREALKWPNGPVSSRAIQAYDAIQVIRTVTGEDFCSAGDEAARSLDGDWMTRLWQYEGNVMSSNRDLSIVRTDTGAYRVMPTDVYRIIEMRPRTLSVVSPY